MTVNGAINYFCKEWNENSSFPLVRKDSLTHNFG